VKLLDCVTGRRPRHATEVDLLDEGERLRLRFVAATAAPHATLTAHDADLWTEDVVELFVAPGEGAPRRYFEIELNPLGAVFDARVESPAGDRRGLVVDRSWDCRKLAATVSIRDGTSWSAELALPWAEIGGNEHKVWRINLFRIDRPNAEEVEHSAWSPTLVSPADFHRPERFGFLRRLG